MALRRFNGIAALQLDWCEGPKCVPGSERWKRQDARTPRRSRLESDSSLLESGPWRPWRHGVSTFRIKYGTQSGSCALVEAAGRGLDQGDGHDGGGFDAQDARAEARHLEAGGLGGGDLGLGKAALGSDQQRDLARGGSASAAAADDRASLPRARGARGRRSSLIPGPPGPPRARAASRSRHVGAPALARGLAGDLLPARAPRGAPRRLSGAPIERSATTGTMRVTPSSVVFCTIKSMRSPRARLCSSTIARAGAGDGRPPRRSPSATMVSSRSTGTTSASTSSPWPSNSVSRSPAPRAQHARQVAVRRRPR